jgi:FkbH-like protein
MKKCLVLDLDNTLWGGIIGEDGIDGLALSTTTPGNSFIAFQQAILDHYNRGVILAINSRNNEEDALHVIRNHPNMILKEHHFAAHRINWQDKATNIRELARELNIGLDSMVFLDDDITNREMVKALVPEVVVPDMPKNPEDYTKFLHSLNYFATHVVTDEDTMRGNLYVTERLRKEQEKQFITRDAFLESLSLELFFYENDTFCIPRLAQLTEKTNQFNIYKQPFSEDDIKRFIESGTHKVFFGKLVDKFGDYGVIIFALVDMQKEYVWTIESMLMSCRVFGRGVEDAFLCEIMKRAIKCGIHEIEILFSKTDKNAPAEEFIAKYFTEGKLVVKNTLLCPSWITLQYENI